jgi:spore germination cell wall hydrolase CwlJ-like protein
MTDAPSSHVEDTPIASASPERSPLPAQLVRWQQAIAVATAVYNDACMPLAPDALYYDATGVQPYWARTKRSVGKIGNHVFYR